MAFWNKHQPKLQERFISYRLQVNEFLHGFGDGENRRRDPVVSAWLIAEDLSGTEDQISVKFSMN